MMLINLQVLISNKLILVLIKMLAEANWQLTFSGNLGREKR